MAKAGRTVGRRRSRDGAGPDAIGDSILADLAPVGLGVATLDGRLLQANPTLAAMLAVDGAESLRGISLATFHAQPASAGAMLRDRLQTGPVRDLEIEALRADGSKLSVRVSATREEVGGTSVVVFSVAPAAPSKTALARGQKMEAMERFAARVAHDYNNILTPIVAESGQLLAELTPSTKAHDSVRAIMRDARRAAEITERLLLLSRAEAGQPKVLELSDAIRALEPELAHIVRGPVELVLRLEATHAPVRIDPSHLRLILSNLISNAAEAMPGGGRVTVETATLSAPEDTEGLDYHPGVPRGRYVSISVGDTGRGMDPDTLDRAFDPFFTTKSEDRGLGLGLTTALGLTRRASGHLSMMSAPACGTVVRALLPLVAPRATVAPDEPRVAPPAQPLSSPSRILVVDDEGAVLRVTCKILRRAGYIVHPAGGAFEAQDEIRRGDCRFDLVISDIVMPGMSGTELATWIRARCPDTAILLLSGYTHSDLVTEWREADPDSFLAKPFEPHELVAQVRRRIELATGAS